MRLRVSSRLERPIGPDGLVDRPGEPRRPGTEDLGVEVDLVGEVVVERRLGDALIRSDVLHGETSLKSRAAKRRPADSTWTDACRRRDRCAWRPSRGGGFGERLSTTVRRLGADNPCSISLSASLTGISNADHGSVRSTSASLLTDRSVSQATASGTDPIHDTASAASPSGTRRARSRRSMSISFDVAPGGWFPRPQWGRQDDDDSILTNDPGQDVRLGHHRRTRPRRRRSGRWSQHQDDSSRTRAWTRISPARRTSACTSPCTASTAIGRSTGSCPRSYRQRVETLAQVVGLEKGVTSGPSRPYRAA